MRSTLYPDLVSQIYYMNTQTGQHSRDLPQETDDEISDTELAGLASQPASRSGTSAGLAFGPNSSPDMSTSMQDIAGFGIPRRTGTPEPWVRKLGDDGRSYHYYNKHDGRIQFTRPDAPHNTIHEPQASIEKSNSQSSSQSSSSTSRSRLMNEANRDSVYSDDSDVQPIETIQPSRHQLYNGENSQPRERQYKHTTSETDHTSAERIARSLQQALAPPLPEVVTELSAVSKSAIQAVVNNIRFNGLARRPEEDRIMDDLIHNVVLAIRNLLYISAVPTGQIPADILPREVRSTAVSTSQSPLKPAQRKVTATLSRLVLSARAMQYDAGSLIADTLHRIEVDAEELEKAVLSFALDVQRTQHSTLHESKPIKRLRGVFGTSNLGLGLVGAGTAGCWKGFGWVSLDEGQAASKRVLGPEVISELKSYLASLDEQFQNLIRTLQTSGGSSGEYN